MAIYPSAPSKYPSTLAKYPGTPNIYPGSSASNYPTSGGIHLLFLAGQSNAEAALGTDSPAGFPDSSIPLVVRIGDGTHPPSNWFYSSGNTPIDLGPASTSGGTFHSLELVAAKNLQTYGLRMAAVKVSINGTHISEWQKGNVNGYFQALVDVANLARSLWGSSAIIHFVWLQSESDATDSTGATYEGYLRQFVADTKSDIGWRDFWQCKLQPSLVSGNPDGPTIVAAQATVMAERSDTHLINFDAINGNLHYSAAQLATMGAQTAIEIWGAWHGAYTVTGSAVAQSATASGTLSQSTAGPTDPLTIVTSKTALFFITADAGITIGTGVSQAADQSGAGKHATQGTGTAQPALQSAALNGRNTMLFDGSNDCLNFATLDLPAPGTTPTWFFMVFRVTTWGSAKSIYGGGTTTAMRVNFQTSSPNIRAINTTGSSFNTGAPAGTWVRLENLFNNATTDYLKLGSTSVTGVNTGNTDAASGAFTLGSHINPTGANASAIEVACMGAWNGKPTAGELTSLDAWVTSYYGASVVV